MLEVYDLFDVYGVGVLRGVCWGVWEWCSGFVCYGINFIVVWLWGWW